MLLCSREPIGADLINDVSIKNFLYKMRKSKNVEVNMLKMSFKPRLKFVLMLESKVLLILSIW